MNVKKRKPAKSPKKQKISEKKNSQCVFKQLEEDHAGFKATFQTLKDTNEEIKLSNQKIEENTEKMALTLKDFHKDGVEVLGIIAGKKHVPLSIFAIVVVLLSALLITQEVKYSDLDIEISTNGIHIFRTEAVQHKK